MLNEGASLANGVKIAVFTIGINHTVGVNHSRVHAPFKTVRMVGNAGDRPIGIARATLGVGVLKIPFDVEVGVKLRNKLLFRPQE
jgi:hypothetical protein